MIEYFNLIKLPGGESMQSKWLLAYWSQLVVVAMCWAQAHAALPQVTPKPAPIAGKQQQTKAITPETIEQKIAELDKKIKTSLEAETEQTAQQLGVNLALLQKKDEVTHRTARRL
jgi:hypothetical protein